MLQSSWSWSRRRRQRRSLLLVCFVIKSWTRSCVWSWAMLRGQLTQPLPHSASCCFSSSATLRIKANFQMPSVFRLVIWTLDCFHSSWRVACAARPHPPFLPHPRLVSLYVQSTKGHATMGTFVSLPPSVSLSSCVCVCAC